jgi:pimeloyl-ACP methyl ester carboxylesterase
MWVELAAGPVEYEDVGAGPVIVLVHGVVMNSQVWRNVVPTLASRARVITPTLPLGAHRRPMQPGADLSMRGQVHMLADFLDALDLQDVTLVPNDWGGPLFLTAEGRDERVSRLVVTPCEAYDNFPPGLPGRFAFLGTRTDLSTRLALRSLRVGWLQRTPLTLGWMTRRPVPDEVIRDWTAPALGDARIRRELMTYAGSHSNAAANIAATEALARFGRPARVIWTDNRVMPRDHGRRLATLLGADLVELPDAYVLVSEDQPEALARELLAFLPSDRAPR